MSETVNGFVILGPDMPLYSGVHTFGLNEDHAWGQHMVKNWDEGRPDRAAAIDRWKQKGWRPMPVRLSFAPAPTTAEAAGHSEGGA